MGVVERVAARDGARRSGRTWTACRAAATGTARSGSPRGSLPSSGCRLRMAARPPRRRGRVLGRGGRTLRRRLPRLPHAHRRDLRAERALALRDDSGISLAEAMLAAGHDPAAAGPDPARLARVGEYVELHIEQGRMSLAGGARGLAGAGVPLGVASEIWPHGRWRLDFAGVPNHAGTTALDDRVDPVLAMASRGARGASCRGGARRARHCRPPAGRARRRQRDRRIRFAVDRRTGCRSGPRAEDDRSRGRATGRIRGRRELDRGDAVRSWV